MRIPTLLQKISDLAEHTERPGLIEIDLMLDYTRVLYADLLEWRGRLSAPAANGAQSGAPAPGALAPPATHFAASPATAAQSGPASVPPPAAVQPPVPGPVPADRNTTIPTKTTAPAPVQAPAAESAPTAASGPAVPQATTQSTAHPSIQRPVPPVVPPVTPAGIPPINEPTLAELAAAMDRELAADDDDADDADETAEPSRPVAPAAHHIPRPVVPPVPTTPEKQPVPAPQPAAPGLRPLPAGQTPKDIRSLITINDKYQIMSELFGNDKAAYEAAINAINESENEAAAIRWLQERLWVTEERSDAVVNFFDLVNRFFRR